MYVPPWIRYGGRVWMRDVGGGLMVDVTERIWPVVDAVADNYGSGLVIRVGGEDAVIDARDLDSGEPDWLDLHDEETGDDKADLMAHLVADDGWTELDAVAHAHLSYAELEELHDRLHAEGRTR